MRLHIYFSTYIIIWSFLYWLGIINYNPIYWLYIAVICSICIVLYCIYYDTKISTILYYILLNSPKLFFIYSLDKNNLCEGLNFGTLCFILYLFLIDFDLYNIYYTQTVAKLLKNNF